MRAVCFYRENIPRGHPKEVLLSDQSHPAVYIIHISAPIPLSVAERGYLSFLPNNNTTQFRIKK